MNTLIIVFGYFCLIFIFVIFFIIGLKFRYFKESIKSALSIMEGEVKIYRKRAEELSEKLGKELNTDDFDFKGWLDRLKDYYELIGIMKGLNKAIRILIFWLPKNL